MKGRNSESLAIFPPKLHFHIDEKSTCIDVVFDVHVFGMRLKVLCFASFERHCAIKVLLYLLRFPLSPAKRDVFCIGVCGTDVAPAQFAVVVVCICVFNYLLKRTPMEAESCEQLRASCVHRLMLVAVSDPAFGKRLNTLSPCRRACHCEARTAARFTEWNATVHGCLHTECPMRPETKMILSSAVLAETHVGAIIWYGSAPCMPVCLSFC